MTRINCVDPSELHQKHLVAEYRELPRIFGLVKARVEKNDHSYKIPERYVLGAGHVTFFYNKLGYLAARHALLVSEMQRRNYSPQFTASLTSQYGKIIPSHLWNDWVPDEDAIRLNRQRIAERLPKQ